MSLDTDDIDQDICTQCETATREVDRFDTNGDGRVDIVWCVTCGSLYLRDPKDVKTSFWMPPIRRAKKS